METEELEKLLEGGVETPQVDFKASCSWDTESLAKDILAMSNIVDGGRIIIGVKEEPKGVFTREGISSNHKKTYDIDAIKDKLAKYADPFIELTVSFPKDKIGTEFCVIRIEGFKEVPVICKLNGNGLVAGGVYYRNRNKRVESALVSNSYDMRDIVERAMIKMRRRASDIGYSLPSISDREIIMKALEERLKKERGDL